MTATTIWEKKVF